MKNTFFIFILISFFSVKLYAGGTSYPVCPAPSSIPGGCASAAPFCTGTTYTFSNTTGLGNQGALECLGSTPNPTWYYLNIANAGNIDILITQVNGSGSGIDVDFALLGPYPSVAAGCANPASACVEDCSFSTSASETANIVGAQVGEIYLLLLTNFSNQAGTITFNQTGGGGATDCTILSPSCSISSISANPTNCNSSNQYDVTGQISFINPPATGTLTVSNGCGGSQTFNAPFTSPQAYSFAGLTPSGAACTISASFSADAGCTLTQNYTSPSVPSVSAGSYPAVCQGSSVTLNGGGASTYTWDNSVVNGVSFIPPSGSTTYTVTGTNAQGCTNTSQTTITSNPLPTVNAGSYAPICINAAAVNLVGSPIGGTFSGTGVVGMTFSPLVGSQTVTYNFTDGNGCSNSASASIIVNPLPFVEAGSNSSFCSSGSALLGTPALPGMTYSWTPSLGLDDANSAQPTATLSTPGTTNYVLTVIDVANGGCSATDNVTVTISSAPNLTLSPNISVCPGGCTTLTVSGADFYSWSPAAGITDPSLTSQNVCPAATTTYNVTGYAVGNTVVTNGDFTGGATGFTSDYILNSDTQSESTYFVTTNANLTHPSFVGVDHTTGTGNFLVVNGSGTPNSSVWCQTIPVQPNTDYVFSTWVSTLAVGSPASLQFSINGSNLSTPFTAPSATNVWDEFYTTWNSGVSTSATICIVNQNTSTGGNDFGIDDIVFSPVCSSTESVTVTVNANPVVSAGNYPAACVDAADITLVGTPSGGTFSGTGVTGNSFDPTSGTQTITYNFTDGNGCSNSTTATITVNPLPTVSAGTYAAVCASVVSVPLAGTPAGGTFSGTGVSGNSFNPAVGTSTISYVYTDGNGCTNNANTIINVNAIPLADAGSYPAVCQDAPNVNLVGSPTGGVFTGTGVLGGTFDPSVGTQTITYTYTDGNGCVNTATATMLVNPLPTINGGADVTVCEGEMVTLNGVNGVSYSWNNGGIDGQPFTPSLGSLVYTVTGTDANGCVNTDNVTVNTLPMPVASITADEQTGYPVLPVTFTNNSTNASSFAWDFGNGQVLTTTNTNNQNMSYSSPGTYIVQLVAGNGFCTVMDTLHILVIPFPDPIVYVPNVFTPNGDGSNDTFTIDTDFAESLDVQIFNRWGNVVKEISGLNESWNGLVDNKEASDGVYFFKYTVTGINGEVLTGHGNVTLIR
jgi:gliding motility-associated-like protein